MRVEQLLNCQISSWYPQFAGVASRTKLVDLPSDFVDFLTADGIYLPEGSAALPKRVLPADSDDSDAYQDWSEEDEDSQQADLSASQEFPELVSKINDAIAELGGAVLPKLNWSCPKDAAWLTTGNTLKCTNAEEVLLLLKGSDRVAHDICHALEGCEGSQSTPVHYTLALRKWLQLRPGQEFRCFVRGHDLIGISQRHVGEHFPGLEAQKDILLEQILEFFEEHIENRFPDPDFTFDIYITSSGKVRLVDFNPICSTTSPLLFTWDVLGYSAEPTSAASDSETPRDEHTETVSSSRQLQSQADHAEASGTGGGIHMLPPSHRGESTNGHAAVGDHDAARIGDIGAPAGGVRQRNSINAPGLARLASPDQDAKHATDEGENGHGNGNANTLAATVGEAVEACMGSAGIHFRVVTEPNRVQPNMPTFGVPFDLVDNSEGGAYAQLLQHLQSVDTFEGESHDAVLQHLQQRQ